ncbi:MAG: aminopeptidase P N-terminal domain-containing protein [Anaeromyxobacteraceae bacterium]
MPFDQSIYAARRARVFEEMEKRGGGVMLLPAAEERRRNADNEYVFRQDSDYAWAVGLEEPQGCAILVARGGLRKLVLFVRPKDKEKEIWTGIREGVEGAKERWGADEAFTVAELEGRLSEQLENAPTLWWRLGQDPAWDARVARLVAFLGMQRRVGKAAPGAIVEPGRILHELRLHKAPEEVARIRKAAEITAEGHFAAMREGRPGRREFQVQAEIEYAFRRRGGNGTSYGTIVAAGANSTILHYPAGNAELKDGDVCLVDAGGEYDLYAGDVTRTFPVSGEFTPAQRDLYTLVLGAQKEALAAVRPGATIDGIHDGVVRRLTEGLVSMGLLKGPAEERIAEAKRFAELKPGSPEEKGAPRGYRKYYMHRTSHWMGLDVHDVGDYVVDGKPRPLAPGMVLTIEPGLYVAADDQEAPAELRGVGIRIEDDALVTEGGCENLTAAVPKEVEEVEAVCVR